MPAPVKQEVVADDPAIVSVSLKCDKNLVFLINDQRYSHTCRICMYGYFAYNCCMNDLLVNILILGQCEIFLVSKTLILLIF